MTPAKLPHRRSSCGRFARRYAAFKIPRICSSVKRFRRIAVSYERWTLHQTQGASGGKVKIHPKAACRRCDSAHPLRPQPLDTSCRLGRCAAGPPAGAPCLGRLSKQDDAHCLGRTPARRGLSRAGGCDGMKNRSTTRRDQFHEMATVAMV